MVRDFGIYFHGDYCKSGNSDVLFSEARFQISQILCFLYNYHSNNSFCTCNSFMVFWGGNLTENGKENDRQGINENSSCR